MITRIVSLCAGALLLAGYVVAEEAKSELDVKCVVAGKPDAKADKNTAYRDGKVYFCCDNCKGKFTADPAKFAVPANMQLVLTKQYKQAKCPISGQKFVKDQSVEIAGRKVFFCCGNCQAKAEAAGEDERKELLFNNEAFEKAFVLAKKEK